MNKNIIKPIFIFTLILFLIVVIFVLAKEGEFTIKSLKNGFGIGTKQINIFFEGDVPYYGGFNKVTEYWEKSDKVNFEQVYNLDESDVIVKVVREYNDETLGFTFEGKLLEIGLGDSKCNANFYSYDEETIKKVITHEFGHIIGKQHSNDINDIMYPSFEKKYDIKYSFPVEEPEPEFGKTLCWVYVSFKYCGPIYVDDSSCPGSYKNTKEECELSNQHKSMNCQEIIDAKTNGIIIK